MATENSILLVDKDEALCKALEKYLTRYGYDAIIERSGLKALDLVHTEPPSIVISEIDPEGIPGPVLLRKIKKNHPEIQVIVLAEAEEIETALECLRLEAADFLLKPINSEHLRIAIARAMKTRDASFKLKRYEKELEIAKKNRALFQQLFDEVPCYISIQDRNLRLTGGNRRFKRDFGDHVGAFCYEVYKHRDEPCRYCPVEDTFKDGEPHQTEEVVTSKDGEQYNVLTWTAPLRDEEGNITQVMEMATNITQIRKLQSHLTSLGLLVGSMSHGIRGVLTALDGGIYRLEKGLKTDDRQKIDEAIEVVKSMIGRIKNMVLDILYYTKERDLNWTRVNILDFSNQIDAIVRPKVEKHNIEYVFDLDCSEASIEIDPGTVSSALVNIVENSIDACIDDRADEKSHQVILKVNENADHVIFETCDNGLGMDRQTKENLFTLFFSSKGNRGTGLGLFVAGQIVEQHGGNIEVESEPGQGSCFRVKLFKKLPQEIKNHAGKKEINHLYNRNEENHHMI